MLTLTTTAGDLTRHLSWVARGLPPRPAIPVLAGIRIDITETEARLTATDYSMWMTATVDVHATGEGSWLLPGRVLADLVARMPAHATITLTLDDAQARVECGRMTATLLTLPVEDYPAPPTAPDPIGAVEAADLAAAVSTVAGACATSAELPILQGVNLTLTTEGITAAATDRYRIAEARLAWQPVLSDVENTVQLLVPRQGLALAVRGLDGTVHLAVDGASGPEVLTLTDETRSMHLRLIDGQFARTDSMLDTASAQEMAAIITVDPQALAAALGTVGVLADRLTPARVSVEDDHLAIASGDNGDTSGSEVIEAASEGPAVEDGHLTVAFQVDRLSSLLADCRTDRVRLLVHHPQKAVLVLPEGDNDTFRHLIMPIRQL